MKEPFSRSDFLEAVFGSYFKEIGNFIFVRGTSDLNLLGAAKFYPNVESLGMAKLPEDQHTLFGVCPRERMKPGRENIQYITALWAGLDLTPEGYSGRSGGFLDFDYAMDAVKQFPLTPSIMVRSGRGMHVYWLLKEVTEITDPDWIDELLVTIGRYFLCPSETGIHATMRLPGTANPKYPGGRCAVTHMDPQIVYALDEFDNLKLPDLSPAKKPPAAARVTPPPVERIPPGRPEVPPAAEFKSAPRRPGTPEPTPMAGKPSPPPPTVGGTGGISPARGLDGTIDDEVIDALAQRVADKVVERVLKSIEDTVVESAAREAFLRVMKSIAGSAQEALRAPGTARGDDKGRNA